MELIFIIVSLLLGLVLLVLEFVILPGTTIAGIGGGICYIAGLVMSYNYFGLNWTMLFFGVSCLLLAALIWIALQRRRYNKLVLDAEINFSAPHPISNKLYAGMLGKSISRIAPMGSAEFKNEIYEVKSMTGLIDQNTEIEIVRIVDREIWVKVKE